MEPVDRNELDEVVDLVRRAGELTLRWFGTDELDLEHKGDGTPVTAADRAAERFLREELARRYPDDTVIGEEEATSAGVSGHTWIIDPIDGTKAFTHGVPLYSNLLARYDADGAAIGVINLPALDETVYAGRGLGCFDRRGPVRVNDRAELASSCLCTSGLGAWTPDEVAALLAAGPLVRTWGDGYGFALVATGRVEAMADPRVALWDVAPMPVIIEEAGGRFTDVAGRPLGPLERDVTTSGIATNGLVHDEVLGLFRTPDPG